MTRAAINNSIWAVSLVLQCWLVALVFMRGVAKRLPLFAALLVLYPLRAAVLFFLPSHIAPDDYAYLYRALSLLVLLLQLIVATEIAVQLWKLGGKYRAALLFVPVVAGFGAIVVWGSLPANSPVPADRVQLFEALVMVLLGGLVLGWRVRGLLQCVVLGFAAFGMVDVVATAEKSVAANQRNVGSFAVWSYAGAIAYLLIVVFWLICLRGDDHSY